MKVLVIRLDFKTVFLWTSVFTFIYYNSVFSQISISVFYI